MIRGNLPYPLPMDANVVIGYPELIERITLFELELDDRVMEILKYYMLKPALESTESEAEIRILFKDRIQEDLIFHVEGLRETEVGVTKIPMETYQKAARQLEDTIGKEPFATLLSPPYISINKIYLEE